MRDRGLGFFPFLRAIRARITGALAVLGALTADTVTVGAATGSAATGEVNAVGYKINGTALATNKYAKYSYKVPSGTGGGGNTVALTWTTLALNSEDNDADGIGTLSGNQITLQAGTYIVRAECVLGTTSAPSTDKLRLRNITDGTTTIVGITAGQHLNAYFGNKSLAGEFTIAGAKTFALQYYTTAVNTNGLGQAATSGEEEVYRVVEIWKVA